MIIFATCIFVGMGLFVVQRWRRLALGVAVLYILTVLAATLFTREPVPQPSVILIPFQAVRNALEFEGDFFHYMRITSGESLKGIVLNILLFIPCGYLVPALWPGMRKWWQSALLGFAFSLTIETTQLITHLGWFDVDDLLNNTLGALVGWWSYRAAVNASVAE